MVKFTPELEAEYRNLIETSVERPTWRAAFGRRANKIILNKERYMEIQDETGVPWPLIGVIHSLECGLSFRKHLHNGDSLARKTVRVPRGWPKRGNAPFTWKESAIDALKRHKLHLLDDWSIERCCYELERYNGWGYRRYHSSTLSPYLWSGTTHYLRGKYVSDGKWSSRAVSKQSGAMPLLIRAYKQGNGWLEPKEVIAKSRKLTLFKYLKNAIEGLFSSFAGLVTLANIETTKGWVTDLGIQFEQDVLITVGIACLILYIVADYTTKQTIADHNEGRYSPSGDE